MNVVAVLLATDQQVFITFCDSQLVALDAGEWFERGTRGAAAVRAVAVQGVDEFVHHRVVDCATHALSGEPASHKDAEAEELRKTPHPAFSTPRRSHIWVSNQVLPLPGQVNTPDRSTSAGSISGARMPRPIPAPGVRGLPQRREQ